MDKEQNTKRKTEQLVQKEEGTCSRTIKAYDTIRSTRKKRTTVLSKRNVALSANEPQKRRRKQEKPTKIEKKLENKTANQKEADEVIIEIDSEEDWEKKPESSSIKEEKLENQEQEKGERKGKSIESRPEEARE